MPCRSSRSSPTASTRSTAGPPAASSISSPNPAQTQTHASAFGFLRNRYIQATNPFSTVDQPAYTRVQAGFTVGGAIIPNKTFYFFATETHPPQGVRLLRHRQQQLRPHRYRRQQVLRRSRRRPHHPGNARSRPALPRRRARRHARHPAVHRARRLRLVSLATTGQNPGFLQPTIGPSNFVTSGQATPASFVPLNALIGNFPISEKTEVYSLRLDHKLTDNQQLLLRANVSPSFVTGIQESAANQNIGENSFSRTANPALPRLRSPRPAHAIFGSNKVNELPHPVLAPPHPLRPPPQSRRQRPPSTSPASPTSARRPFSVVDRIEDQTQIQDNFTYTRGWPHRQGGIDLRYIPINLKQGQLYGGGDYTFAALNATDVSPALAGLPGFSPIQAYGLGLPQSFAQGIGITRYKYDLKTLGASS